MASKDQQTAMQINSQFEQWKHVTHLKLSSTYKKCGYSVILVGAAAKAITVLQA